MSLIDSIQLNRHIRHNNSQAILMTFVNLHKERVEPNRSRLMLYLTC